MAQLFGSNNPLTAQLIALALPKSDSKKPNKSTGAASRVITPAIVGNDLVNANARRNKKDSFTVDYYVGEKEGQANYLKFTFALLPAIDNIVNYSASGPFRGNESVPEVKPGIPIRTAMKHRNTVIPGGTNVIQTIGIDSKYIVLVGAFVGTEKSTSGDSVGATFYDTIYQRAGNPKGPLPEYSSYKQAKFFNDEVVEKGAPVNITIQTEGQKTDDSIKVTGVIVDFKIQAVREAKTYYAMTILYTNSLRNKTNDAAATTTAPTTTAPASSSKIPTSNNPTKPKDLKRLPASEVAKELKDKVWDSDLVKKIEEVYGFSGEADGSHFKRITSNMWDFAYKRKDNSGNVLLPEIDNIIFITVGRDADTNSWFVLGAN